MPAGSEAQVVLRLDRITKRFVAMAANDAISFELACVEVVALLGENGAGKTTLMNVLFGHYVADEGSIEAFGQPLPPGQPRVALSAGIGMVHQHFTLADDLSVLENIVLGALPLWRPGYARAAARARIRDLSARFGLQVDPEARAGDLSVGKRQRTELLKALYRDARILILDEPTAVLTPQETRALFRTLRLAIAQGLAIIFISHKLGEVKEIAGRVVVLRHGRPVAALAAAGVDPAALARLMIGADAPHPATPAPPAAPAWSALLRLERATTRHRGATPGLRGVDLKLRGVDLELRGGRITGLAGVSGNGQSALATMVFGLARPASGRLRIDGEAPRAWSPRVALAMGVARIPEDRHRRSAIASLTLAENAVLETYRARPFSRRGWMNWRAAESFASRLIDAYDVRCSGPQARIGLLSGGNMQKLILGRALAPEPRVILADQPTRGLDPGAVAHVRGRLLEARARGAAILLILEDLDEIRALSDTIHVIRGGTLPDGTSADIALIGETIAAIGRIDAPGAAEIDAAGDLVAPHFVDPHFHMDATLSYGLPRLNASGTLLEGIALWGELREIATLEEMRDRALAYCDWAAAQGLLAIRTHGDVTDDRLLGVQALLEVKRIVAPWLEIQLVAFP
jgi:general nucleoside transport system ATP-binding protein